MASEEVFKRSEEIQSTRREKRSVSPSAKRRNFIPGGALPTQSDGALNIDDMSVRSNSRSRLDHEEGNSDKDTVENILHDLRTRHTGNYDHEHENIPDGLKKRYRRVKGLNSLPRKIRVGRETQRIIDYASTLSNWMKESDKETGIAIGSDEIDTIRQLVSRATEVYPSALRSKDEGTKQSNTDTRNAALEQLTQIAQELQAWDQYRLKQGDRPLTSRESRRRENIEHLLQQLPPSRPPLEKLPASQRWRLYIDTADHNKENPSTLYEAESPGYRQSMEELITRLITEQKSGQKKIDYEAYTKLHEYATAHVPDDDTVQDYDKRSSTRKANGVDGDEFTFHCLVPRTRNKRREQQERLAALEEMRKEVYNGLPLYQDWPAGAEQPNEIPTTPEMRSALPRGIIIGQEVLTDDFVGPDDGHPVPKGTIVMRPLYSMEEGKQHIEAILNSYYEQREIPEQTDYQKIKRVVRTIRALHVVHQKINANWRVNRALLYQFLQDEGFSPTIFPGEPPDFRGYKTLDSLAEATLEGMHTFTRLSSPRRFVETF